MKWTDAEDIGIALVEKFPGVDPLTVRFTDLREQVLALDGFDDDPKSRTSRSSRRFRWRGTRSSRTRNDSPGGCSARACAPTSSRSSPASRSSLSAFLPWVVVDGVALPGFPDVLALWIVGLGVLAAALATLSLSRARIPVIRCSSSVSPRSAS